MSLYGKKVIAVLDTNSTFGVKFQKVIDDVDDVSSQMASLMLDAPAQLDTLKELADALGNDPGYFTTIAGQVSELNADVTSAMSALGIAENDISMGTFTSSALPDAQDLKTVLETFGDSFVSAKAALESSDTSLSARLNTLEADPTTATALSSLGTSLTAVDATLSGRLDVLESDPTTKTYVDAQVSSLIDGAPDLLNTLDELAAAINDDENVFTSLTSADTALSARITTLEADPTTQTALDVVNQSLTTSLGTIQADVDANETASDVAEAALSARIATLEVDPTTATALAAVQADVDQNESDADASIAVVQADVDANEVSRKDVIEFESNLTKVKNSLRSTYINIGNNIELVPAAAGGRVEITGDLVLDASDLTDAADDTAAAAAGVIVGGVYHNSGAMRIRLS